MKPIIVTCCGNQIVNSKAGDDTIVQDVRFVPTGNAFFVELVYKFKSMPKVLLNKSNALGINNLATLISNQPAVQPVLVNGKMIKSVKRLCWINDYLHKVSRFIINYALMADAGTLVIGHNFEWKKSINIGKLNNQKFVSIPHARLIEMIHYKADETGLTVIVKEESYISKDSHSSD
ncbi:IS200/IS605 family accessory protein TnpB-related protein [Candidatus Regiella insecticola]|uniref:IS200/IS605 family accessory protein TnpB-related protein n=1 Tax=Candidatus Regiella insecticola TaxID=138073 RepID=UPI001F2BFF13|nr:IS200/IS605 family accessory protein TnpB-related protein [Candidatus Regiella insecticola]